MRRHARHFAPVAGFLALAAAAVAVAQTPARRRVLHEDLPAPATAAGPLVGDEPRAGQNPAAFASGDKLLPEPDVEQPAGREPVLGTDGFAADRETETRPDRETGSDGTLRYASVFNPDVLPFKRMSALDAVDAEYTLGIARVALAEVPVGGATDAARDRFWGSVMIELKPGVDVPLPSVAPDMRVLSYETEPPMTLAFSKDGADNFYVRSDESSARGTVRLVFLADADAGYFAPALPPDRKLTPRRVRQLAPDGLLTALPPGVKRAADKILADTIHVDDSMPIATALDGLVGYFRAFEAKEPPPSSGDIYRDLTESQAGVCRHRAFAFMITANALGIPTRYVSNEAHAFVEVWLPARGWQRIDLGGAALRLEVTGADDKTLHRPRGEDPFAKPQAYDNSYTQLDGDIRGLSGDQLDEKKEPLSAGASGDFQPMVDGEGPGSTTGAGGAGDDQAAGDFGAIAPGTDRDQATTEDPAKPTPKVSITLADQTGYRGETLHVEGRVDGERAPIGNLRVDVFLAPLGRGGAASVLIGRGATGSDGRFAIDADLPASLDLSTYELFVSTPGDARHNAAVSE
jgi:transglutaminase-like putative cysteine protease